MGTQLTAPDLLHESMASLRRDIRGRLLTFLVIAASFLPLVGWPVALAWLAAAGLWSSFAQTWLERVAETTGRTRGWSLLAAANLATGTSILGAIGVFAALKSGLWGLVAGEFELLALLVMVTSSAGRSAIAYYASAIPLALYLLVLAVYSFTLGHGGVVPVVLSVGTVSLVLHTRKVAAANRRMANSLEEARAAAEDSTAAKSAFVAMVSHELRTPLSGILAGTDDLGQRAGDAASRNSAALVSQSARMMHTLLDDLLDLSKIEAGRMGVEALVIDLRQTLLETVRFWRPELRRKGLTLRLEGARQLPQWVTADPTRLRQILNNLFSNSAKFTERGGLILRAGIARDETETAQIVLEVSDTGPGMSEEQVARLFRAFEQLGHATARLHGGTGLGLHISRELARLMAGDLSAASVLGQGSTFRLALPLALAQRPAMATVIERDRDALGGLRLLIVDDHEVNRQAFSLMLGPLADHLACAADGAQALAVLAVEPFDLVLMDIHMPGIGGLEATRRLRATAGPNRETPVIALTGSAAPADVAACAAAGMVAHVSKPASVEELFAAIAAAITPEQLSVCDPEPARREA